MKIEIIFNVLIAMFAYNIILKSIGKTLLDSYIRSKPAKEPLDKAVKTLKERLEEKQKENN